MSEKFKENKRNSSEQTNKIPSLERTLDVLPIEDQDRIDIVLLLAGQKIATDVTLDLGGAEGTEKQLTVEQQSTLELSESHLSSLGLAVIRGRLGKARNTPTIFTGTGKEFSLYQVLGVAREVTDAQRRIDWDYSSEVGQMSGYPESAIRAFESGDEALLLSNLSDEVKGEDFAAFILFRLSTEHWIDEIETARKWAEVVRQQAPALYERVVRDYHERIQKAQNQP
jgi:hypothetical protein